MAVVMEDDTLKMRSFQVWPFFIQMTPICPLDWEGQRFDFLSPLFLEGPIWFEKFTAAEKYKNWLNKFLLDPQVDRAHLV